MKIIDFRVRPPARSFVEIDIFPKLKQEKSANWGWCCTLPPSVQEHSMRKFLGELEENGVVHAVVWGRAVVDPRQSVPHEDVAELVREGKGLFSGFGGIAYRSSVSEMIAAVDQAVNVFHLKGITVEPGWGGMPLMHADDPKLYPVYERCQDLGAILALRMGTDLTYSNPQTVDRVAGDFPKLKIVISHAFWPYVELSCGLAFRRPNIYLLPDLFGWSMPGYLKWVEAANTFMQDRMIFGSAYPLMGTKDIVDAYLRLPYKDGVCERVMYGNAARLLALPN